MYFRIFCLVQYPLTFRARPFIVENSIIEKLDTREKWQRKDGRNGRKERNGRRMQGREEREEVARRERGEGREGEGGERESLSSGGPCTLQYFSDSPT